MMLTIVDYGMGNLGSVTKAFNHLGFPVQVTGDPVEVRQAEQLVLPGVGAFGAAMANLEATGLDIALRDYVRTGRPLLGICLGMQLLASIGEEMGSFAGLAIIPGKTRQLAPGVKLPQVGWNRIDIERDIPLLRGIANGSWVYFVHSYCFDPAEAGAAAATTEYGERFCSVVAQGNVYGVQFHPEKSSQVGLSILGNFARLTGRDTYADYPGH